MKLYQSPKQKIPEVITRGQMAEVVREIAGLRLDERLLQTDLDADLQGVRKNYDNRFKALNAALEERLSAARVWAETNPAEFRRKRSISFAHGVAGFRWGAPRLRTVAKGKWDAVLEALHRLQWGAPYIRVKEEINKEHILADVSDGKLAAGELRKAGAQVVREEAFFLETDEAKR